MDIKQWLSENTRRRITDQDVANALGTTRKTANKRLNEGLEAGDLITICQELGVNRTMALVELGYVPHQDVLDYLDSDGELVSTADEGTLSLELARRLNPATMAKELDELEARRNRSNKGVGRVDAGSYDGTVKDFDWSQPHAADSSADEQAEREKRGEDPID
mgnify:CR=1 FL=1